MNDVLNGVLPLVGVAVGAGLQFLFGRSLEASKQLKASKAQAYADYFKALALAATKGRSPDTLNLAADSKTRICIYGSAEVVNRIGAFEEAGAIVASDEGRAAVVALLRAMRSDVGGTADSLDSRALHLALFGGGKNEPKSPLIPAKAGTQVFFRR